MPAIHEPNKSEHCNVISRLETVDCLTGERIVHAEFYDLIEAPNWTQDGKRLIYNSQGRIYSFDIAKRESTLINTGFALRCNNDHVLSPDNSAIAVSHHTQEDGQSRIYTLPLTGGNPVLITPLGPSYLHGWSPEGSELAYCAARNGQYDIYTIPANGGVETQLTDAPGLNDGPEYAPDGQHIWFNSVRTGLMQVWRMKRDGSEQTQMTFDESNNWFPHVSPNGESVAFISYNKGDVAPGDHPPNKHVGIRLMSSQGGDSYPLVNLFGGQGTLNVNSWSPDSRQLAFVSYEIKE
ncbi:transporter [Paenibacillus ferrarius]|uniref:Transporter n=1 Tax=Paenibacillus ferrarius TaxID=1469647 RepID=A0A1V4HMU3_9BACL|nr:TolB family protein [Paenibacillus ferrarius]OPH58981.1 transporter [Paenibacillus ferrarius]